MKILQEVYALQFENKKNNFLIFEVKKVDCFLPFFLKDNVMPRRRNRVGFREAGNILFPDLGIYAGLFHL